MEVEDSEEEARLEDLAEGRVGNIEEGDGPVPLRTTSAAMDHLVRATLPIIPYCGFEPLVCHLMREKRTNDLIRLDQVGATTPHTPCT